MRAARGRHRWTNHFSWANMEPLSEPCTSPEVLKDMTLGSHTPAASLSSCFLLPMTHWRLYSIGCIKGSSAIVTSSSLMRTLSSAFKHIVSGMQCTKSLIMRLKLICHLAIGHNR